MRCYFTFRGLRHYLQSLNFQQDGTPPHPASVVRRNPDIKLPDRWIVRGEPTSWPASPPEMIPCYFLLWGYVKTKAFHKLTTAIVKLGATLSEVVSSTDESTIRNVFKNIKNRLSFSARRGNVYFDRPFADQIETCTSTFLIAFQVTQKRPYSRIILHDKLTPL